MTGNNLQIIDTGLDHRYLNGLPIVEAEIDIKDVLKKVARISSLAANADPYFSGLTAAQKIFSESHGEGDRITRDFLEEGARELLSMFSPFQRLIPEGNYDSTPLKYEHVGQLSNLSWINPDSTSIFVNTIEVKCISGRGDITFIVDGNELGTVTLPDITNNGDNFLAYDLAGYLAGELPTYNNYSASVDVRNNNIPQLIELIVSNNTEDFVYDANICAIKYDAIGWIKALTQIDDVRLPSHKDSIHVNHLVKGFSWDNNNLLKVSGVTVKHNSGSADVKINYNNIEGVSKFIDRSTIGEDYFNVIEDISNISIELENASDDFNYDLIISTELPNIIPSPRFEFDSTWNPGKIIYRYQNMDTRDDKLNYTSETLKDIRVDPNIFEEVLKYLKDSLKNYILRELYLAIGYDKKAVYYANQYETSRRDAKFWIRSEKGLQTQYTLAGI